MLASSMRILNRVDESEGVVQLWDGYLQDKKQGTSHKPA
jgi:hypothetical protein